MGPSPKGLKTWTAIFWKSSQIRLIDISRSWTNTTERFVKLHVIWNTGSEAVFIHSGCSLLTSTCYKPHPGKLCQIRLGSQYNTSILDWGIVKPRVCVERTSTSTKFLFHSYFRIQRNTFKNKIKAIVGTSSVPLDLDRENLVALGGESTWPMRSTLSANVLCISGKEYESFLGKSMSAYISSGIYGITKPRTTD